MLVSVAQHKEPEYPTTNNIIYAYTVQIQYRDINLNQW